MQEKLEAAKKNGELLNELNPIQLHMRLHSHHRDVLRFRADSITALATP